MQINDIQDLYDVHAGAVFKNGEYSVGVVMTYHDEVGLPAEKLPSWTSRRVTMLGTPMGIAERLLHCIQDGLCELCGELCVHGGKIRICDKCALEELLEPCKGCRRVMGRASGGGFNSHPVCKRRGYF